MITEIEGNVQQRYNEPNVINIYRNRKINDLSIRLHTFTTNLLIFKN